MKLKNLKASFILKNEIVMERKKKNNVFKHQPFTFNIYHHSPHIVHVTGVKSIERMKLAQCIIEEKFHQKVLKIRIENMFYSQKNYQNIDLIKVHEFLQNNELFHVDYNVELFAGMYLLPKNKQYPTIIFFRTGSYTIMGGKQLKIVKECETFVKSLIERFDKKRKYDENKSIKGLLEPLSYSVENCLLR